MGVGRAQGAVAGVLGLVRSGRKGLPGSGPLMMVWRLSREREAVEAEGEGQGEVAC